MFRSLIGFLLFYAVAVLPASAEAGGPNMGASSCQSDVGVSFTGGLIFGRRVPDDEIGAPITGGLIFGGRIPDDEIGSPINGGLIFGRMNHRSVCNSTPIVERPNRPFHFYGNSARRAYSTTGARGN